MKQKSNRLFSFIIIFSLVLPTLFAFCFLTTGIDAHAVSKKTEKQLKEAQKSIKTKKSKGSIKPKNDNKDLKKLDKELKETKKRNKNLDKDYKKFIKKLKAKKSHNTKDSLEQLDKEIKESQKKMKKNKKEVKEFQDLMEQADQKKSRKSSSKKSSSKKRSKKSKKKTPTMKGTIVAKDPTTENQKANDTTSPSDKKQKVLSKIYKTETLTMKKGTSDKAGRIELANVPNTRGTTWYYPSDKKLVKKLDAYANYSDVFIQDGSGTTAVIAERKIKETKDTTYYEQYPVKLVIKN